MQRTHGNAFVQRLIQRKRASSSPETRQQKDGDEPAQWDADLPAKRVAAAIKAPSEMRLPAQKKREAVPAGGSGEPLGGALSASMGAYFGADFSNVRVHTGGKVEAALADAGARAMAQGSDIYFRSGEYDPGPAAAAS